MKKRIISGIIMAIIIIPILYFGGVVFDIFVSALAIISFKELIDVKSETKIPFLMKIIGLICMLLLMFMGTDVHTFIFGLSYETLSLVFLLLLVPTIFFHKHHYKVNDAFYLAAITIFLGIIFNLCITLYNESLLLFIFIIVISCTTDVFALLGGKLIGRHTFTEISPNKTIEGCLSGLIVATIVGTTYYMLLINDGNIVKIVLLTALLSLIGQIGDLFFSLIKRENNVKDFSNLIPGHGGILDRIDSIIFILITFVFIMQYL